MTRIEFTKKVAFNLLSLFALSFCAHGLQANSEWSTLCPELDLGTDESLYQVEKIHSQKSIDNRHFIFLEASLKSEEDSFNNYFLVEKTTAPQACRALASDSSFIGYLYGVDDDLKAQIPREVYEWAIHEELKTQLTDANKKNIFIEKLKARQEAEGLSRDFQWVLQHLEDNKGEL